MPEMLDMVQWGIVALVGIGALGMLATTIMNFVTNRGAQHTSEAIQNRIAELHASTVEAITSTSDIKALKE